MKYLLAALFLAIVAGVEFHHAYSHDRAPDPALCVSSEERAAAIRDALLVHLRSH